MAGHSNTGFVHDFDPLSDDDFRMLSFQTDVLNSTTEMNSGIMCSSSGSNNAVGSFPSGSPDNFGNSPATFNAGTSFGSGHREWVRGLKHDSKMAVVWTYEEQNVLNDGLIRFAGEGHIMKYIKIAALLPNKSARDVALRIRWLVKHEIAKRHKLEEHFAGKRIRERKEKNRPFSPMMHHASSKKINSIEVSTWDGSALQLMDETNQILSRIATNLGLLKLQDNIDLFCHTRNSILSILSSMRSMAGIMGRMPPLPISLDDELLYSIFSHTSQAYMCGSHGDFDMKQEPKCYRESNPL